MSGRIIMYIIALAGVQTLPLLANVADNDDDRKAELVRIVTANEAQIRSLTDEIESTDVQALTREVDSLSWRVSELEALKRTKWGEKQRKDSLKAVMADIYKLEKRIARDREALDQARQLVQKLATVLDNFNQSENAE